MLLPACLWAEQYSVYFKTSPRLELLRPLSDPATLSVLVTAADGRPVPEGWVEIRLDAPKSSRWFSTDFPVVEGSRLVDMRLDLSRGKADWRYVFPIRGEYHMTVDFVTPEGKQASQSVQFNVREHATKWFFLGLFIVALFAVGFIAGRIFSSALPGAAKRTAVYLAITIYSVLGMSPGDAAAGAPGTVVGRLEVEPAVVGRPALVRWRLEGNESAASLHARLTLSITHLEKGITVFAVEKLPVAREFSMKFQFTDGAEYRVVAVADLAGSQSVRSQEILSVTAVEPPPRAMLPPLALFLIVIAGGLAAGRASRRRVARSIPGSCC